VTLDFSDLESFYPGSRERRQTVAPLPASAVPDDMLGDPVIMVLNGRDTEFFYLGQIARALGRKPGTLRKWESEGILPSSGYVKPSKDPRGRRRLYTRQQADGIIRAAKTTGVMDGKCPLDEFGRQVRALFAELRGAK
jgi:hypothetical protein